MNLSRPILVTFSGMDGAGKSTQIENLQSVLASKGLKTTILTFWDDVVVLSRYREGFVRKVFKSESGVGERGKPVNRRDKNVRGWHLSLLRHGLYALDCLNLCVVIGRARQSGAKVIIVDRYIYDELVNLPLENKVSRTFARVLSRLSPQPDLAFVLDAEPEAARERKPEYPLDFLRGIRAAYLDLANSLGAIEVIPPLSISEVQRIIELAFFRALAYLADPNLRCTRVA
jgi:thymidylate kinase